MAHDRLELHKLLVNALGSRYVYFQPTNNVQMVYPCIVYSRDTAVTEFAGNLPYKHDQRYTVTVIDRDPDSLILPRVAALPTCTYSRHFVADNLNHDVYNLYF